MSDRQNLYYHIRRCQYYCQIYFERLQSQLILSTAEFVLDESLCRCSWRKGQTISVFFYKKEGSVIKSCD